MRRKVIVAVHRLAQFLSRIAEARLPMCIWLGQ
jgi:hypothetical protein